LGGLALAAPVPLACASAWHLDASFGRRGVADLPVRERLREPPNQGAPGPPERYRSLLVAGPQGSVFVGGYAEHKPGAFLLSRISSSGRLLESFGHGGVMTVPAIFWIKRAPPRMLALPGGGLLIVGLDKTDQLAAVRVTASGGLDRGYGRGGVAHYSLLRAHGFTIITAAVVQPDGDLLVVYQKELPQPENQPRVPEGQGNGSIHYVRLLPSGALDSAFGNGGLVAAQHPEVSLLEGESGTVGACAETLSPGGSLLIAYEGFALEEFSPAGQLVENFGEDPVESAKGPEEAKNAFHFCNGLFSLPGGSVEGVDGREIVRLTPSGTPEGAFGEDGTVTVDGPSEAATVASGGETFTVGPSGRALLLTGILPNGRPDPALGARAGQRFPVALPRAAGSVPGEEEKPTWEVLALPHALLIRAGRDLVRLNG